MQYPSTTYMYFALIKKKSKKYVQERMFTGTVTKMYCERTFWTALKNPIGVLRLHHIPISYLNVKRYNSNKEKKIWV